MDQVTRQERKAKLADLRLAFEARTVAFVPELERLITEASMPLSLLRAYFYLSNQAGYVALFGIAGEVRSSEVDLESLEVRAAALKAIVGGIKEYYGGGLATRQERDAAMQAIIDFTSQLDPCIFKHIDQRQTVIEEFIKIRDGLTAIELRGESPSITVGEFLRLERSFVSTCVLLHNSLKAPTHLPRNDLDSIIVDTAARPADQAKADKYVARHSARIAEELQRNEFPGRAKVLSEMHRLPVRVFRKVLKGLGADEVAARISSLPQEYRELWSPVVVAFPEVLIQEAKLYEKWVVAFTAYCKDDPERFKFFYLDPRRYPKGVVTV